MSSWQPVATNHPSDQRPEPLHTPQQSPLIYHQPNPRKRKHSLDDGSPGDELQDPRHLSKTMRAQPVKRACNECRQQKLKCNVSNVKDGIVPEPCTRCVKHKLQCTIDPSFRRLEKRQHTADLERELAVLRQQNMELTHALNALPDSRPLPYPLAGPQKPAAPHLDPNEAAASRSLLDLAAQGHDPSSFTTTALEPTLRSLGNVTLNRQQIADLFRIYFAQYHPFLPLLADLPCDTYFSQSPLLYWTVITVASRRYESRPALLTDLKKHLTCLLWDTMGSTPQTYHVVKALCLICAWPLPIKSTSSDPSMMICGAMLSLAMQFGLHRPSHAQDFSRNQIEVRDDDIKDRMSTWVAVNIVAQNVSTGYGMPQLAQWNWYTHGLISPLFRNRCIIEKFVDKVTRTIYTSQRDGPGTCERSTDEPSRAFFVDALQGEYRELETIVRSQNPTTIDTLHLHMAALHLRLTVFFDSPDAPTYRSDLRELYVAATTLLKTFLSMQSGDQLQTILVSPDLDSATLTSRFATKYIMQMILAAGCTLLKLLNSFFAPYMDNTGRQLFSQAVAALRSISVVPNDLPQRLAEVLAQLWQASGEGDHHLFENGSTIESNNPSGTRSDVDASLQLKIRCRMSMSLVYDSVWRWRDRFGAIRNLDRSVEHPTQPDGLPAPSLPISLSMSAAAAPGLGQVMHHAAAVPNANGLVAQAGNVNHTLPGPAFHDGYTQQQQPVDQFVTMDLGSLDDWDGGLGLATPFDSLSWALDAYPNMGLGGDLGYTT